MISNKYIRNRINSFGINNNQEMFQKKQQILETYASSSLSNPYAEEIFNSKVYNHDFFLLVRDQNYEEAYKLGMKILKNNPNNQSIYKFCKFIEENSEDIKQIQEDKQYYSSQESEEQQQSSEDQNSSYKTSQNSSLSNSSISKSNQSRKSTISNDSKKSKSDKSQTNKKCVNKIHHWTHKCQRQNCPNKK